MPNFQQVIKQASDALLAHEIGKQDHVNSLWKSIGWLPFNTQALDIDVERSLDQAPVIRLYPSLLKNPKAVRAILREFGLIILALGTERAEAIWTQKLVTPAPEDIKLFDTKLKDPDIRKKCHTYEQLAQTYPEKGHSVERLIAIHLCNALLANNVSYPDSIGVDIYAWGPTAQFSAGKKYYSLVPLTSAYCPGDIHRCFGCALAALITDNFATVLDRSVAAALRIIIRNVVQRASSASAP
jgi:hypothetical protein